MRKMNFRTNKRFSESLRKLKEDNYWSIVDVENAVDTIKDVLGVNEFLDALIKAMDDIELKENLEYICRMYDIEGNFLEGYSEDYDEDDNEY